MPLGAHKAAIFGAAAEAGYTIEILVIAGGGGGSGVDSGLETGGGGGAGGVVYHATYSMTAGVQYDLTVGAGGSG